MSRYIRLVVALLAALALATTHWKAYHSGGASARAELAAAQAEAARQLAEAVTAARERERQLQEQADAKLATYTRTTAQARRAADAARSDLQRLRDGLAPVPATAGDAQTCAADRARADRLGRLLAEGAGLVEEGGRRVDELEALIQLAR